MSESIQEQKRQIDTLLETIHPPHNYIYRVGKNCITEKLLGKYIPTKYISSGSFGIVYLVCGDQNNCKYVVKIMRTDTRVSEERVLKEIKMAQQMGTSYRDLPTVGPKVIDTFSCDGEYSDSKTRGSAGGTAEWTPTKLYFIIMEKMDMTFAEYVKEYPKQYSENRETILDRIRDLFSNLYSRGYIHRDMHGENIMVNVDMGKITDIKIIDFDAVYETKVSRSEAIETSIEDLENLTPFYSDDEESVEGEENE